MCLFLLDSVAPKKDCYMQHSFRLPYNMVLDGYEKAAGTCVGLKKIVPLRVQQTDRTKYQIYE